MELISDHRRLAVYETCLLFHPSRLHLLKLLTLPLHLSHSSLHSRAPVLHERCLFFLCTPSRQRVLELGAGTGALSVGLSRAGAASVTCTDLPCHIPRIKATVEANTRATGGADGGVMARSGANEGAIHVAPLRWGDDTHALAMSGWPPAETFPLPDGDSQAVVAHIGSPSIVGTGVGTSTRRQKPVFDVIVMSEVLYWPGLDLLVEDTREPLRSTIVELSKPGTSVFLVYKER